MNKTLTAIETELLEKTSDELKKSIDSIFSIPGIKEYERTGVAGTGEAVKVKFPSDEITVAEALDIIKTAVYDAHLPYKREKSVKDFIQKIESKK